MSRLTEFVKGKPSAIPTPSTEVHPPERMVVLAEQLKEIAEEILALTQADQLQKTGTDHDRASRS